MEFEQLAEKVMSGNYLTRPELDRFAYLVQQERINDGQFVAMLTAMQTRDEIKGRSIDECGNFVDAFRQRSDVLIEGVLCNSGTGGDRVKTLNISTPASIVIASAGIPVLKTGSKGTTGSKGSREAFEALGLKPLEGLDRVIASTQDIGIGYYDFSKIIPLHGRSGLRTPLNYMGPLCHPTKLTNKVLGCADETYAIDASRILDTGITENYLISFNPDVDEISLAGQTRVIVKRNGERLEFNFDPQEEGLPRVPYSKVAKMDDFERGTDRIVRSLQGEEPDVRYFIAVNAGAGIYLADKAKSISEGFELANSLMESGKAYAKLEEWRAYQNERKRKNI